ncbi:MAG: hypothetical protein SFU27_14305, partial [Thermonemataceae bacterium]|nr:hypothetical protein [Thermonemataceae bacterium]
MLLFLGNTVVAQCIKIDSLEALLVTAQSRQRVDVLNELSVQYRMANNPRVALDFANQAIGLANRLDYQTGLARAWVNEAIVVYAVSPQNKNFQEAIQSFNRALRIHKRQKDNKGMAETYTSYGQFYFDIAYANHTYYDSSVTYLEKAFELLKQSGAEGTPTYSDLAEKLALVYYEK